MAWLTLKYIVNKIKVERKVFKLLQSKQWIRIRRAQNYTIIKKIVLKTILRDCTHGKLLL